MRIGKRLEWDDIKVGQAFYFTGCYGLAVKVDTFNMILIDVDTDSSCLNYLLGFVIFRCFIEQCFDIPLSLKQCLQSV